MSHLLDTTAGYRYHCLKCWGSGQTPLQISAGTVGPGCTWCLAALLVTAWYSLGHPADSPLWLQYKATLYEIDYIVVKGDYRLCGSEVIVNVLLFMCGMTTGGKYLGQVVSRL